jgi:GNAT superfamily N-acetyltransferase
MVKIEPLDKFYLPQVLDLVNAHLGAVVPGWALTACYFWERLKRNPAEWVTDPWVAERKSIVGVVNDRVCAAAHILRYGDQTPRKGTAEVAWLLFWPRERTAGEAILKECLRQMKAWQVTDRQISGPLPVPVCVGLPHVWPHIGLMLGQFGYSSNADVDESVYGGTLDGIPSPGEPPVEGASIHRDLGKFSTRFVARLEGRDVAYVECVADLTQGGQLPALSGWGELSEVETSDAMRNRGLGSWVMRHAVEWLRLSRCSRIVLSVAIDDEEAGAGRFYRRFGWAPLVRQSHWTRNSR